MSLLNKDAVRRVEKVLNNFDTSFKITILNNSGLPNLKFGKKIDFEELYKSRLN